MNTPQEKVYDRLADGMRNSLRALQNYTKQHHAHVRLHARYDAFNEALNVLIQEFPELLEYSREG